MTSDEQQHIFDFDDDPDPDPGIFFTEFLPLWDRQFY